MDCSSDDSFAWTNASSENSDTEPTSEITMTTQHEDGAESESGSSYKKKLQKQLFPSEDNSNIQNEKSAKRAKKRKYKQEFVEENKEKSKSKLVKSEPESDVELFKKKKRKKRDSQLNGNLHDSLGTISEESYLNMKVKEEQSKFLASNPLKRKKEIMSNECETTIQSENADEFGYYDDHNKHDKIGNEKDNKQDQAYKAIDDSYAELKLELQNTDAKNIKKKTKKKKDHTENSSSVILTEKFSSDEISLETAVAIKKSKNSRKSCKKRSRSLNDNLSETESVQEENAIEASNNISDNQFHTSRDSKVQNCTVHSIDQYDTTRLINNESSSQIKENVQRIVRISDRIRFEDENSEVEIGCENGKKLLQVEKYRKAKKLMPVSYKLPKEASFSHNDEIWILKCPQDMNSNALAGVGLTIDHKCKVKVGGLSYEGSVDGESTSAALLASDRGAPVINLFPINGVVNLRRRVPKPHYVEDKVMVNNQTDFIPLPETKCRHPLFGSDYKRATKLSESVRERLNGFANLTDETGSPRKKNEKKKKRKHREDENIDGTVGTTVPPRVKLETRVTKVEVLEDKQRKRKHSSSEEISTKKSKRRKQYQNSAEVWESEKAIEENLFNY